MYPAPNMNKDLDSSLGDTIRQIRPSTTMEERGRKEIVISVSPSLTFEERSMVAYTPQEIGLILPPTSVSVSVDEGSPNYGWGGNYGNAWGL